MKKPVVMLLFSAALVGAYFFMARRASASETGGGGLFDFFGESGAATGATGGVPFADVQPGQLFPGGGSSPLPLGIPGASPGSNKPAPSKTNLGSPINIPTRGPIGTVGPVAPRPLAPGRIPPGKPAPILQTPRPAPRSTPVAVRAARGTLGQPAPGKGRPLRALD